MASREERKWFYKANIKQRMKYLFQVLIILLSIITGESTMAQEHLSLVTTPIILQKNSQEVSQGSGFYYILTSDDGDEFIFLVTNYHVLTGHPPQEREATKGDRISFYLHNDAKNPGQVSKFNLKLFTKDGKPIWLTSQSYLQADLAVIPFSSFHFSKTNKIENVTVFGISEKWINKDIKIRPASKITLIGYPYGYFDQENWLPIWKTGNVASEPEIDFEDKPLFLVDVSAFPGMSGSPVFGIFDESYEKIIGGRVMTTKRVHTFLGILASIQMVKEKKYLEEIPFSSKEGIVISKSLDLAHVWKTEVILEILNQFDASKYQTEIVNRMY